MTERQFNQLFAENLNYYLEKNQISQRELARNLGVSSTTVSNWCRGTQTPRMTVVDKICQHFNISRKDLTTERIEQSDYYLDPEAAEMAKEMYNRPELKVLFDASRNVSEEDILNVSKILSSMKKEE